MRPLKSARILGLLFTFLFASSLQAQDNDFDVSVGEDETGYQWQTPAGKYLDPNSFFSLHGYVNGVYAGESEHWLVADPTQLAAPGQLLVPNTDKSAFQYDVALIFGSEMSERTRILFEAHYVSDPSGRGAAGPGGSTIAITEATGSFDLIPQYLTISGGLFWSPFGIVNKEWLGAQNNFGLLPRAMGAYPVHFNERGVRLNGFFELGDNAAINYVASIGNGVSNYNISGQSAYDNNNNKTITSRIGIFPGLGKDLDIGFSYMMGDLRDVTNTADFGVADPERYVASTSAFGADLTFKKNDIELRGYYISSSEDLEDEGSNSPGSINREGYMAEATYLIRVENDHFLGIKPRVRYDFIETGLLQENGPDLEVLDLSTSSISFGVDLVIADNFRFSFDHTMSTESGQTELKNDRFVGKIIAQF